MEQSYIDSIRNDQKIKGSEKLERLETASNYVSDMDLCSSMIMGGDQHWELLPLHAMLTVAVGHSVKGWISYPQFPQWLGKNSSRNKKKRLLSDLTLHLHGGKLVSGTMYCQCEITMKRNLILAQVNANNQKNCPRHTSVPYR